MKSIFRRPRLLGLLAAAVATAASCSPGVVVTTIPEDHARLKALTTFYAYACRDLGRAPNSVDQLLPILQQASVKNPRKYLTSTRDGQPYAIVWGLDLESRDRGSLTPLAYEQTGIEGKRLIVTCNQEVRELSEEEFSQIDWPGGHQPSGSP